MTGRVATAAHRPLADGIESGDSDAIERMIDEGGPVRSAGSPHAAVGGSTCPRCGGKKTSTASRCCRCARRGPHPRPLALLSNPPFEVRLAERRAALPHFRLYCFACGRSSDAATVPSRPGRCSACGGSMLTEDQL